MEIFFSNFNEETQKAILAFFEIEDPKEMNWDTIPMFILENEIDEAD